MSHTNQRITAPLEAIQAPAASLLTEESLAARVRGVAASPRAIAECLGRSHEGREIWGLVVAAPEALGRLAYHEAENRRIVGPRHQFRTLEDVAVEHVDPASLPADAKVTVMIAGTSFGFEASHVEALVELAEYLATSGDARVKRILDRLLIVIVPLMNPDGRAAAIREWQTAPLCTGYQGSGNAYGILINRDFFNVSQPETRAVRAAITRFQPVAAYDPHEDMYHLSETLPYACWTPPFAKPYHPDIHPRVLDCIGRFGAAIAEEWRRRDFNFLYSPTGDHEFLSLFRLGGRFHLHLCLQGVPALITESARMPGAQTWRDRIDQKVSAGLAFLDEIAAHPEHYAEARYAVRSEPAPPDAFILPAGRNGPGAIDDIVGPLLQHGALVFEAKVPEPAYVVPTNQPDGRLIRALLTVSPWNHVALPPLAGATCLRLGALPPDAQASWKRAPLEPVRELPKRRPAAFANGAFSTPRIAVYTGQGVDQRHHVLSGSLQYALDQMHFPYVPIEAGDVRGGALQGVDLLIVPGGWAEEIVRGWEEPGPRWRRPGKPDGLGDAGLAAIREFAGRGGCYLGIGSGGGLLASSRYLGLVDATLVDELLGEARATVQVVTSHPLTAGLLPSVDEIGRSTPGRFAVPYFSEAYAALHGGPIFKAGPDAHVLAEYAGIDDPKAVRAPEHFDLGAHTPAVLYQPHGKGWSAIVAFEVGLRGVWRSTLPILANAVSHAGDPDAWAS